LSVDVERFDGREENIFRDKVVVVGLFRSGICKQKPESEMQMQIQMQLISPVNA
jgi:hypothetical protein